MRYGASTSRVATAIVTLAVLLALASTAGAAVIHVTTQTDETTPNDGLCSLREAISEVDTRAATSDCGTADAPANTISLAAPRYTLTIPGADEDANATGDLDVAGSVTNLTIVGAGMTATGIDATGLGDRVLDVAPAARVTISGLAIVGGHAPAGRAGTGAAGAGGAGESGGGIRNQGTLTLSSVAVALSAAGDGGTGSGAGFVGGNGGPGGAGGGIDNTGTLSLIDGFVGFNGSGNGGRGADSAGDGGAGAPGGDGAGIASTGSVSVTRSFIGPNNAGNGGNGGVGSGGNGGAGGSGGGGGGIFVAIGSTLSASDSAIAGNNSGGGGDGAGGDNGNGGNGGAGGDGGGVLVGLGASASLLHATVAFNAVVSRPGIGGPGSGGTNGANGPLGTGAGIIDLHPLCSGVCTRLQNSIVSQNDGGNCAGPISDGGHDLVFGDSSCPGINADPKLVLPSGNAQLPFVMAIQSGSPAIDAVPAGAGCSSTDQRGVSRPQGPACDIGAYEWAPPTVSGAGASASGPTTAAVTAAVNANARDTGVTVDYGATSAYGSTTPSRDVGSATTAAMTTIQLTGLAPGTTYHARVLATNADGTTRTGDLTFTTPRPGGGTGGGGPGTGGAGGGGARAPVIGNLRQSAARWRAGSAAASMSARRRPPIGTRFSFTLNVAARVTFSFTQPRPGRRVGGRCVAPRPSSARRHTCTRTVIAGTLTWEAHAGADAVHFAGGLSSRRRLRPGRYTLRVVAVNAAGRRSATRALRFTIVP